MRLAGFIFSFYILVLAALPCCMIDDCPDDNTEQAAGHEQEDDPALPADRACGSCSPFFSCEGCAAATVAYEPFQFELVPIRAKPVFTSYLQQCLPQADIECWQPPKLG